MKHNKSIDGDNLRKEVSIWLQIREMVENPFPQSNIIERWEINKKKIFQGRENLKFKITTVKDIEKPYKK